MAETIIIADLEVQKIERYKRLEHKQPGRILGEQRTTRYQLGYVRLCIIIVAASKSTRARLSCTTVLSSYVHCVEQQTSTVNETILYRIEITKMALSTNARFQNIHPCVRIVVRASSGLRILSMINGSHQRQIVILNTKVRKRLTWMKCYNGNTNAQMF